MALALGEVTGAAQGERNPDRLVQRNGQPDRHRPTRVGTVALRGCPGDGAARVSRPSWSPAARPRTAPTAVIREACVQGISTRSVDDLVRAMGMEGFGRSRVSRSCAEIDDRVRDVLARPIEGDRRCLWPDACGVTLREAGVRARPRTRWRASPSAVPVAGTIAVGVDADGRREVLGMAVGGSQAEPCWPDALRSLKRRGLNSV